MDGRLVTLSKSMSYLLRHGAVKEGVAMAPDGTVLVRDMLALKQFKSYTLDDVMKVVENNEKKRFAISGPVGPELRVCAQQGHSKGVAALVENDLLYQKMTSPPLRCIHGTYFKFWDSIKAKGLSRMTREHMHFTDLERPADQGQVSGFRANCEVLIHIDVEKAMQDGCEFFRSGNGVILSAGWDGAIPSKYFSKVTKMNGEEISFA